MEITEGKHIIHISRIEIQALLKGLTELKLLEEKYPDERNGYDLCSHGIVAGIRITLEKHLQST